MPPTKDPASAMPNKRLSLAVGAKQYNMIKKSGAKNQIPASEKLHTNMSINPDPDPTKRIYF